MKMYVGEEYRKFKDIHRGKTVWFIPQTSDLPQLKVGRVENDEKGKFIGYGQYCDDGDLFICPEYQLDRVIVSRINGVLREILKDKFKEQE